MKGVPILQRLRAILAILIAVSLTLAPIASAWAAAQMRSGLGGTAIATNSTIEDTMSDCMKAMQAQHPAQDQNCPCCDVPAKGACPDVGGCLAKCSVQVIAVLVPAGEFRPPIAGHNRPAEPQKPPDRAPAPPAPPPRT